MGKNAEPSTFTSEEGVAIRSSVASENPTNASQHRLNVLVLFRHTVHNPNNFKLAKTTAEA